MLECPVEAETGEVPVPFFVSARGCIGQDEVVLPVDESTLPTAVCESVGHGDEHLVQGVEAQIVVEGEDLQETGSAYAVADDADTDVVIAIGVLGEQVKRRVAVIDEQRVQHCGPVP